MENHIFASCLFPLLIMSLGCMTCSHECHNRDWKKVDLPLVQSSLYDYEAFVRTSPLGRISIPPKYQLVITIGGCIEIIPRNIADLIGYMQIDTKEKALAFCRMLTNEETRVVEIREWFGWEIGSNGQLLGRTEVIPVAVLNQVGWMPAEVIRNSDSRHWEIHRFVYVPPQIDSSSELVEVWERVSDVGEYIVLRKATRHQATIKGLPVNGPQL